MREPAWLPWVRRIVLSLLALFTLAPIYVMVTSALKPLRDVQGPFRWWPLTTR